MKGCLVFIRPWQCGLCLVEQEITVPASVLPWAEQGSESYIKDKQGLVNQTTKASSSSCLLQFVGEFVWKVSPKRCFCRHANGKSVVRHVRNSRFYAWMKGETSTRVSKREKLVGSLEGSTGSKGGGWAGEMWVGGRKLGFGVVGEMKPVVWLKNGIGHKCMQEKAELQGKCIGQTESKWKAKSTKAGLDGHGLDQSWIPENKAWGFIEQIRSEQKQMAEWFESLKINRRVQCLATSVFLTKH